MHLQSNQFSSNEISFKVQSTMNRNISCNVKASQNFLTACPRKHLDLFKQSRYNINIELWSSLISSNKIYSHSYGKKQDSNPRNIDIYCSSWINKLFRICVIAHFNFLFYILYYNNYGYKPTVKDKICCIPKCFESLTISFFVIKLHHVKCNPSKLIKE